MTVKALAALAWITQYCRHATYFLKADDDAFVNGFAAIKHLRDIETAGYRRRLLMCLVWHRPVVARRGKWAVSRAEFGRRRYPTYCCGLGYVVTGDVVALLLSAAAAAACHKTLPDVGNHVHGNPLSDVTTSTNLPLYNIVTKDDVPDSGITDSDDSDNDVTGNLLPNSTGITYEIHCGDVLSDDVTRNFPTYGVTVGRRFWIDDVYVTGLLVEALGGHIHHTNMSAAYCKSDKMAAVYHHVTEWYKYLFTQVGDDEAQLYTDTWSALRQRAGNVTIPSPSVTRPGRLADDYLPLSTMLQLARNTTQ